MNHRYYDCEQAWASVPRENTLDSPRCQCIDGMNLGLDYLTVMAKRHRSHERATKRRAIEGSDKAKRSRTDSHEQPTHSSTCHKDTTTCAGRNRAPSASVTKLHFPPSFCCCFVKPAVVLRRRRKSFRNICANHSLCLGVTYSIGPTPTTVTVQHERETGESHGVVVRHARTARGSPTRIGERRSTEPPYDSELRLDRSRRVPFP